MATPWNSGTAYSPGAVVSYNGLEYVRSVYPLTATSGTPPNEELGTDPKGDSIRTWTLRAGDYSIYQPKFMTMYYRVIGPTWDTANPTPEFSYSGPQSYAVNGYQVVREVGRPYGESVEWDQFKDNASPTPDSPVCPANKCGVAMQQFQETTNDPPPSPPEPPDYFLPVIMAQADHVVKEDNDRIYYIYVRFNHPLYFRRSLTVLTRVKKTKSLPLPAETSYINTYTTYVPTDKNYVTSTYGVFDNDYFTPANAAFDITIPTDVDEPDDKVTYTFEESEIVDATSND
jgi:hypothetical protein